MILDILRDYYAKFSSGQKSFFGDWEEDKHPRSDDGKFASKGEEGSGGSKAEEAKPDRPVPPDEPPEPAEPTIDQRVDDIAHGPHSQHKPEWYDGARVAGMDQTLHVEKQEDGTYKVWKAWNDNPHLTGHVSSGKDAEMTMNNIWRAGAGLHPESDELRERIRKGLEAADSQATEEPEESDGGAQVDGVKAGTVEDELADKAREALKRIPGLSVAGMSKQLGVDRDKAEELLRNAVAERDGTKPPAEKPTAAEEEKQEPADLFPKDAEESEEQADESPRDRAARETKRQLDEDYAFARASEIPNVGEDLLGSARHKVNAWKGLEDAEDSGQADKLVTRDQLAKLEPHTLSGSVQDNPISSLAMHLALKAFPNKPGAGNRRYRASTEQAKRDRSDYLDAYRSIKGKAEDIASRETNPVRAVGELQVHVKQTILDLRAGKSKPGGGSDRYNAAANSLVSLYNSLNGSPSSKVLSALDDFRKAARQKYGEDFEADDRDAIRQHTLDIMEGKSLDKTFGRETDRPGSKSKRFNATALYVKNAKREGGRKVEAQSVKSGTKFVMDDLKMRGLQWGNSVSDSERIHHLQKSSEAFADLMDVVGLPDEAASMEGVLGLAIGARGHGTASAHYEPGNKVINLTRSSGVGTVAHEWGHFFDHHIGGGDLSRGMEGRATGNYMSEQTSSSYIKKDDKGNWEVNDKNQLVTTDRSQDEIWSAMDKVRATWKDSGFKKRLAETCRAMEKSGELSEEKSRKYWQSGREIFARTFERYVQRKLQKAGRENTYLSGLSGAGGGLWPTDSEVDHMEPAFDAVFAAFRRRDYPNHKPAQV